MRSTPESMPYASIGLLRGPLDPEKTTPLTIEGRAVTVPEGTSILEAAKYAGILIPHYCYHPGLPEDFGGNVLYVTNRCIYCTRCVRFMDDMAHDAVLNVSERGDRAVIGKFEGKDLTHAWAGNVIDLCPVGALLSKDSLNKARAWELDRTASVCPNCSQGCNMIVETRDNMVTKLRPRPNDAVNKYFMCDYGRLNYRWMNRQDRVDVPMVRRGDTLQGIDWQIAIDEAARVLAGKRAFVLASPMLSNEALYLLAELVKKAGGAGVYRVEQGDEAPLPGVEDLSLRADRAANARGAELLGFTRSATPRDGLGAADVLIVADEELAGSARRRQGGRHRRHRRDAARVGAVGRRRPADRQHGRRGRHLHQSPRSRAALHAGQRGAGLCAAELVRAVRSVRRDRRREQLLARQRCVCGARGGEARIRGDVVRHARSERQGDRQRRRAGRSKRMTSGALLQAAERA